MIPEGTTLDELTSMFKQFGKLDEIVIIKNGDATAKGYGFCRYDSRDNAFQAIKALNGKTYLHVVCRERRISIWIDHILGGEVCRYTEPKAKQIVASETNQGIG